MITDGHMMLWRNVEVLHSHVIVRHIFDWSLTIQALEDKHRKFEVNPSTEAAVISRDVKRLSVYRLSFIFLVLVFEFQKPIIVSSLALSSSRLKDASPRSAAIGRLVSLTH